MPIGNVKRTFRKKYLDQVMFLGIVKKWEKDALVFYNLDTKIEQTLLTRNMTVSALGW